MPIIIENNHQSVDALVCMLLKFHSRGHELVFDLDGVLFDASHRQACHPDGSLNLELYRQNATPENIAKDKSLPLLGAVHRLNSADVPYDVCTARLLCEGTRKLLKDHGINPISLLGRLDEEPVPDYALKRGLLKYHHLPVLVDDNEKNIEMVTRDLSGIGIHVPWHAH